MTAGFTIRPARAEDATAIFAVTRDSLASEQETNPPSPAKRAKRGRVGRGVG